MSMTTAIIAAVAITVATILIAEGLRRRRERKEQAARIAADAKLGTVYLPNGALNSGHPRGFASLSGAAPASSPDPLTTQVAMLHIETMDCSSHWPTRIDCGGSDSYPSSDSGSSSSCSSSGGCDV